MADDKDKKKKDEKGEGEEGGEKKKKPLLLFIIIGVVFLLLAGGGAYFFLFSGPSDEELAQEIEAEGQKGEEGKAKKKKEEISLGVMYELDPFIVNLADPKARHYVKATITLELEDDDVKEKTDKLLPKIRNDIILLLSSQTLEDVITMEGKIRLRDEIIARLTMILGKNSIRNIYFAQFVVQ